MEEKDKKVKELQDNIAAVSFTSTSKMGKMLMAKCKTLQEENEEIGNQANEGKVLDFTLSGDILSTSVGVMIRRVGRI